MHGGAEPASPSRWLSPERVFVALTLIFGAAFAGLSPPNDPPDEVRHMARSWLISEGRIGVAGSAPGHQVAVPRELIEIHRPHGARRQDHRGAEWLERLGEPLDLGQRTRMSRTSFYSPLPYLPQVAALALGRALGVSATAHFFLGRAADLLGFVFLGWLAIRLAPLRRWPLALVLLTPMSVYQAGAMSADPTTIGLAALWFAGVLRLAYPEVVSAPAPDDAQLERAKIGPREIARLAAIALALGLAKPGYWSLGGLALIVPPERFRDSRWRFAALGIWAVALLVPTALWSLSQQAAQPVGLDTETDPAAQLAGMLADPLGFVDVIARTLWFQMIPYVAGFTGVLGQLDIALPLALYALVPLWIIWAVLCGPPDPAALGPPQRWGLVGLFALTSGVMLVLSYLAWNPVGAPIVIGVQGRYFLPMAPLLLLAIPSGRIRRLRPSPRWLAGVSAAVLGIAVAAVARHYYGGA